MSDEDNNNNNNINRRASTPSSVQRAIPFGDGGNGTNNMTPPTDNNNNNDNNPNTHTTNTTQYSNNIEQNIEWLMKRSKLFLFFIMLSYHQSKKMYIQC